MTYKGKEKFRSKLGGFISSILLAFIILLFAYKIRVMINRSNSQVKKNSLVKQSNSYSPPENLAAKNNSIAFMLADYFGEKDMYDPRFGRLNLIQ